MSLLDKTRDNLRDQYRNVKIIIIDEMSMIRSDQIFHLHLCLQEIMNNDLIFGGVSLLLLGDLMQLRPCRGNYIYQEPADSKCERYMASLTCGNCLMSISWMRTTGKGRIEIY